MLRQIELMVWHYLHREPATDLNDLMAQYVDALWIEERQVQVMTEATARAFNCHGK